MMKGVIFVMEFAHSFLVSVHVVLGTRNLDSSFTVLFDKLSH